MKRFTYFFMFLFFLVGSFLVSMQINDDTKIIIKTIEAVEHTVSYGVIKECETIKHLIEHAGPNECITVSNLTAENFNHIVKIIHYSKLETCSKACVENYIKENILQRESIIQNNLISLFSVANYLDCKVVIDTLFDVVVDYFNDKETLALFEKNPFHQIFTSLPKNLLIQKILINKNRLYEWLLTMYEYESGFTCDQNQFAADPKPSEQCPLRLFNSQDWAPSFTKPCKTQFIAPHGTFVIKFYSNFFKISRSANLCTKYYVEPHMSTLFPDGNGCIIIHNKENNKSNAYYESENVSKKNKFLGITTCINACNNKVARGTSNSIEVYDRSLKGLLYKLDFKNKTPTYVALSPDGNLLAYVIGMTLYVYSSKLYDTISFTYESKKGPIRNPVFNQDGTLLSFSLGFRICTRMINESIVSDNKKILMSNKESQSSFSEKIPKNITYIPGTNFVAFTSCQVLYVINPCTQKVIFQKRMNGSVTNIFFNEKEDALFFLEELHVVSSKGICLKKIDIEFLRALDAQLSHQQVMLLKLIQEKIWNGLKFDLENKELKKIFDSLPIVFQQLLSTRLNRLSFFNKFTLKTKIFCGAISQWFNKKNNEKK